MIAGDFQKEMTGFEGAKRLRFESAALFPGSLSQGPGWIIITSRVVCKVLYRAARRFRMCTCRF